jgi:hypothetical protein
MSPKPAKGAWQGYRRASRLPWSPRAAGRQDEIGLGSSAVSMLRDQDPEDTTARLQARARTLDDLIASGTLADVTILAGNNEIQAQLDAITTRAAVEE